MNADDYFLELPEITYDPQKLLDISLSLKKFWKLNITKRTSVGFDYLQLICPTIYQDHAYIRELAAKITANWFVHPSLIQFSYVRFEPHYTIPPHLDRLRYAGIVMPVYPLDEAAPIQFIENGEVVAEHCYKPGIATMINTQKLHTVQNNQHRRMNFQLSIYDETWASLIERYRDGVLFP